MSTLAQIRARVELLLQDTGHVAWSTAELDECIQQALEEYSRACPLVVEAVVVLAAAGCEIPLEELSGLLGVCQAWWPWNSATPEMWPANQVRGWRLAWDEAKPFLILAGAGGAVPQAGDEVRLWYTRLHTIENISPEMPTTLSAEAEGLVVLGAAALAALSGMLDRREVLDRAVLRAWGLEHLQGFRDRLERVRARDARTEGDPWGAGWLFEE